LEYKGGRAVVEHQELGKRQAWYQLHHDPKSGKPYLGEPCPKVSEHDTWIHNKPKQKPEQEEVFVVANESEPATPFTPMYKGKQRADTDDEEIPSSPKSESTNKQLLKAKKDAETI
jgi:hypothetical protein